MISGRGLEDQKGGAPGAPLAVLDVGNARVSLGMWVDGSVRDVQSFPSEQVEELGVALKSLGGESESGFLSGVAIASVAPESLGLICNWIEEHLLLEPLVVGRQIPLPIVVKLDDPEAVGVDRICNGAAAFDRIKQACVIVDCGTAITVDVIDDEGAFMGGAILPGLEMQARALHEYAALRPYVQPVAPEQTVGDSTRSAILTGIYHGTVGAIRGIVEAYATEFQRWPPAIATGGDAELIAKGCRIFDEIVPDLCLRGVGLAYDKRLSQAVSL